MGLLDSLGELGIARGKLGTGDWGLETWDEGWGMGGLVKNIFQGN